MCFQHEKYLVTWNSSTLTSSRLWICLHLFSVVIFLVSYCKKDTELPKLSSCRLT
jgi:hypothetical protein